MALTQVAFTITARDEAAPAIVARSSTVESITPSGSNQATTATCPSSFGGNRQPVARVATDTAVYVSFGTAPNATSDTIRFFLPANAIEYFYVLPGQKAAVVTA